jgi:hypothetical protein
MGPDLNKLIITEEECSNLIWIKARVEKFPDSIYDISHHPIDSDYFICRISRDYSGLNVFEYYCIVPKVFEIGEGVVSCYLMYTRSEVCFYKRAAYEFTQALSKAANIKLPDKSEWKKLGLCQHCGSSGTKIGTAWICDKHGFIFGI